jgi:hypothetical protein
LGRPAWIERFQKGRPIQSHFLAALRSKRSLFEGIKNVQQTQN